MVNGMNVQQRKQENHMRFLNTRVARLETANDQLSMEVQYIDSLLRQAGFEDGLATLKQAAFEFVEDGWNETE
jgi:hypothetical protein